MNYSKINNKNLTALREENISRLTSYEITTEHQEYLVYKSYHNDLFSCLLKYSKGRLLDIGCGNKPYATIVNDVVNEYIGCDIVQSSEQKVDILCEATNIKEPDESFDTIISTQTIEHISEHQLVINEAYRLLRRGGYFIISGPMYWPLHEEPYDFFRFTKFGFRHILEKAGFHVIEERSNGGKWALCGQVLIHTIIPDLYIHNTFSWKAFRIIFRLLGGVKFLNNLFYRMDKKYPNSTNTMNYVFVSQK